MSVHCNKQDSTRSKNTHITSRLTCLAICHDCAVVPLEHIIHHILDCSVEHILLAGIRLQYLRAEGGVQGWRSTVSQCEDLFASVALTLDRQRKAQAVLLPNFLMGVLR